MKIGFVYILRSLKNNRLYIGSTTDIKRRLHQHEIGNVKATAPLRPLRLELSQKFDTISSSRAIEHGLKKLKRKDYIDKIIKEKYIKMGAPTFRPKRRKSEPRLPTNLGPLVEKNREIVRTSGQ